MSFSMGLHKQLIDAFHKGNLQEVQMLFIQNPTIEINNYYYDYGCTLLHLATKYGHLPVVEFLIGKGAAVTVLDDQGYTPLHAAVERGFLEIAQVLLNNKADINAQFEGGWTTLHEAVYKNNAEIAQLLIDNKANLEARTNFMETPLHWAVQSPYTSKASINMTRTLLNAQADVNAQDYMKYTPLLCCAILRYNAKEHAKMLSKYMRLETEVHNNPTQETVTNSIKNGFTHLLSLLLEVHKFRPTKQHIELAKTLWQKTNDPIYKAIGRILVAYYAHWTWLMHQVGSCHPEAQLPAELVELITSFESTSNTESL
jgi:Ankyrin repeats (3 copies)